MNSSKETFLKPVDHNSPHAAEDRSRYKTRHTRQSILPTVPVIFGLPEIEAAASIGISQTKFRELVATGVMPTARKIGGKLVYDVDELRLAFKNLPHQREDAEVDTWADVAFEG